MSYLQANPKRCQNILKTLMEMLEDRGYTLDPVPRQEWAQDAEVARRYYEQTECVLKAQREAETALVMAPKEEKLTIDTMRKYVEEYQNEAHIRVIIIIQSITPAAKDILRACKRFELFYEKELFCNATRHTYSVPHRALSPVEEKALLAKYKCEKKNLPSISNRDVVARYFAWPIGTVVEIQSRMGGAIEPSVYYRVVMNE